MGLHDAVKSQMRLACICDGGKQLFVSGERVFAGADVFDDLPFCAGGRDCVLV